MADPLPTETPATEAPKAAPPFIAITVHPETSDINVQTNITLKPVILGLLEQAKWLILQPPKSKLVPSNGVANLREFLRR